jgi:hypothetical protein
MFAVFLSVGFLLKEFSRFSDGACLMAYQFTVALFGFALPHQSSDVSLVTGASNKRLRVALRRVGK